MTGKTTNVKPEQVNEWVNDAAYQIVDVREPFEYAEGHIVTAENIPLGRIDSNLDKFDKNRKIVVTCRSGVRSLSAAKKLNEAGYDVYNMIGGMLDWTYETK